MRPALVTEQVRSHAVRVRRQGLVEAVVVAIALGVLAALVYGPHAIHGGFLSDGWANVAIYEFAAQDGFFGAVDSFLAQPNVRTRPLYAVYLVALNEAFGQHMGFWLAWLGAMSVLMSTSVYALLRELRFARLDAALVAALVLIFPAATSLRLWTAVVQAPLTIALVAFGLLIALRAFGAEGPRRLVLHAASLTLFVVSLLLYEAALPVMLASVLLYRLRVPWRTAAARWAVDCAVLVPIALAVTRSPASAGQDQDLAGAWRHGGVIVDQAHALFATVVLPLGSDSWHVLALVALVPAIAIFVASRLGRDDPARQELRRWLTVVLGGLAVTVLGYSIFVPGIDYYAPLGPGIANRINAVPSVGWVLILYGMAMLCATLVFRGLPRGRRLGTAFAVTVCALVGVGWLQTISRDANAFELAYLENERVLGVIEAAVPDPPDRSTIWAFGQPVEMTPGIPVFGSTWDLLASVQLRYDDPTIAAYPAFPGTTFDCRRDSIVPGGSPQYRDAGTRIASPYDHTFFVDTTTGAWQRIQTPAQCRQAASTFPSSPALAVL